MPEHAAIYASPDDPLDVRVVLDHGDAGIYELNLRHEYGEDVREVPSDWRTVAKLDAAATGRSTGRARHGTAPSPPTVHERDCAPCDAARQLVTALAARWDPADNWSELDASVGPGTLRDEALGIAAGVLHRFPLGGTR